MADAAARRLGAGRELDGTLVRTASGFALSASLRRTDGGGRALQAEAAGSLDSLPVLVDRLAAQLLAEQGGATAALGQISSARAIAAYLQGKAAHRRGRYVEAVADFAAALREDSTFALAALDQIASAERTNHRDVIPRASQLAWNYRAKLGPKGQALLRGWVGPNYPEPSSMLSTIAAWQQAAEAAPDVPDAWFELGDMQLHYGALNDLSRPVERAEASFRRALELDSAWVLPLDHLALAKLHVEDTVGFRALVRRWVAQDTVPGDRSPVFRLLFGLALGDSALIAQGRAALPRGEDDALLWVIGTAQAEGMGLADVPAAITELERRAVTGPKLWQARSYRREWLLNTGRPAAALALTDSLASGAPYATWAPLTRMDDALFGDGDTAAAVGDLRHLEAVPAPGARTLCRLGLWSLAHDAPPVVRRWSGRLRALTGGPDEQFNRDDRLMCADLLDAWLAWRDGRPEVRRMLDRTDSLYLASDLLDDWPVTNLVTARLREAIGDTAGAARVISRMPVALPIIPPYRSTYLREQARIWLAAGDTAEAVRALRRLVALRRAPEPGLRAASDSARDRLAALVAR
jgi:tetratricopeptide (TPR) repeat protein